MPIVELPPEIRPIRLPTNERASIIAMAAFADYGIQETHRRSAKPGEPTVISVGTYTEDPIQVGGLSVLLDGLGQPHTAKGQSAAFYVHTATFRSLLLDPISNLTTSLVNSRDMLAFIWTAAKYGYDPRINRLSPRPTGDQNLRNRQTNMLGIMDNRVRRTLGRGLGEIVTERGGKNEGSSHIQVENYQEIMDWLRVEESVMGLKLYKVMEPNPAEYIEVTDAMVDQFGAFAREAALKQRENEALTRAFNAVFRDVKDSDDEDSGRRLRASLRERFFQKFRMPTLQRAFL